MEERKRSLTVLAVIGVLLFLLIIIGVIQKENQNNNYSSNNTASYTGNYSTDYEQAFTGEGKKVLFIGSSSCSVCTEFTPYMKYLSEAYNFKYYYIDAATISTEKLMEVLEKVEIDIDDFGTPYVAFLENGEKYDEIPGYMSESDLFDNLKEDGIIASDANYISSASASSSTDNEETEQKEDNSAYSNVTFIDYDGYEKVYNGNEKAIVVLGQTGCGACASFKPVINEIAKETGIKIYYVNMTEIDYSEAVLLMDSLSYFNGVESWGTPLTLIIENKEVVAAQEGYNEKKTTLEFFQENGFGN